MDPKTPIELNLTVEKVNLLLTALGELPYRVAADLIAELNQQAAGQLENRPKAPAKEK